MAVKALSSVSEWVGVATRVREDAERLVATVATERPQLSAPRADPASRRGRRSVWLHGSWREVGVVPRAALGAGDQVLGPAVVEFPEATCLVRDGWRGHIDEVGTLVLERS